MLAHYPHASEPSSARLTKIMYLADWRSVLTRGRQLTELRWRFDNHGRLVRDVMGTAAQHPELVAVEDALKSFRTLKRLVVLTDRAYVPLLADDERGVLDYVVALTAPFSYDRFIHLVYSTYPIVKSERYTQL